MSHEYEHLIHGLDKIYAGLEPAVDYEQLAGKLLSIMRLDIDHVKHSTPQDLWTEQDVIMITYADSLCTHSKDSEVNQCENNRAEAPLHTLQRFLDHYAKGTINGVHLLPFFPFSSDDGFSVMDYSSVNPVVGNWEDIEALSSDYRIMGDLVINHASSRSLWFDNFIKDRDPGKDFFLKADPSLDWSHVVRPRTTPLFKKVLTERGEEFVWCTFSHDQVDFDFKNPRVLLEFVKIIRLYLDKGITIFRLDAVAFLWKEAGSRCINLEQTHAIVRLLRMLIEWAEPRALIITETNIPSRENLSYFGNGNEAHCVYNFSLPPLLVNTLISGNSHHLNLWMMGLPPLQPGTTYFNFIASHDGIGLRPVEGILDDEELHSLIAAMQNFGGEISWRALANNVNKPYEINISLFDALQGTNKGKDQKGVERFLCAHAIMLGIEGIPGLYIHSLLGTRNDYQRMEHAGHNRAINRHQWDYDLLQAELDNPRSDHHRVYQGLKHLIDLRCQQPAFHPNASQFVLHLGEKLFGFQRESLDGDQIIYCVSNISDQSQSLCLSDLNIAELTEDQLEICTDLISNKNMDPEEDIHLQPYQTLWLSCSIYV